VRASPDGLRFAAALVAGQVSALLALVVFGGPFTPMLLVFLGSAAGPLLLRRVR
jgi:hypothetical protein